MAASDDSLTELELSILRAIANWQLTPATEGNLHELGMAAISKVRLEKGGDADDWFRMKRKVPHAMETLVLRGYLDENTAAPTAKGREILAR